MTKERLTGLALMHMHHDIAIDVNEVLTTFAQTKRRLNFAFDL